MVSMTGEPTFKGVLDQLPSRLLHFFHQVGNDLPTIQFTYISKMGLFMRKSDFVAWEQQRHRPEPAHPPVLSVLLLFTFWNAYNC